jgi:hypothetical protein
MSWVEIKRSRNSKLSKLGVKNKIEVWMGPRFVKHRLTQEWTDFSYTTDCGFASENNCRVFAQNAHVAIEVYDFYVKLFNPDYETVSVYDERFDVQYLFREKPKERWRSVDYYNPRISVFPLDDGVEIRKTFDTDYGSDSLVISYIVRTGVFLKHRIVFTNKTPDLETFRVVMKMTGITSNKIKCRDEEFTVTGETHKISPYFMIGESRENMVLTEYLFNLGENIQLETSPWFDWIPTTLQDIVFDVSAQGSKVDIYIGNYVLAENESLEIDPATDTWQVSANTDDCWVYDLGGVPHGGNWDGIFLAGDYIISGGAVSDATQLWLGCGMRFLNVTILKDSTIDSAFLKITSYDNKVNNTVNTRIDGEDVGDAATFSTVGNYNGRIRTTANVDWDAIPAHTKDVEYTSPNIKTVPQEIVNRGDWGSGNDMVIFWEDHGSDTGSGINRQPYSFESGQPAAKLEITYTAPVVGVVPLKWTPHAAL